MSQKPSLPKGTRDFGPEAMMKRNFIFKTIRACFEKYGFQPIETPSLENLSTLTGKYGDEGDQLLFKILNSGDFLKKTTPEDYNQGSSTMLPKIAEKGLRYDLTVPFARFVVSHQHELSFPFKRYQMQPVWRADRPQKGRYREFYQCDADIIGSDALSNEAELIQLIGDVFTALGLSDYEIHFNNRKILSGLAEYAEAPTKESELCVAIDKLDKIGLDKVLEELDERGFSKQSSQKVAEFLQQSGDNAALVDSLSEMIGDTQNGKTGIQEVTSLLSLITHYQKALPLVFDPKLARGLSYYTGTIIEVKPTSVQMGSIVGGGRYDNLTGVFGMPDMSGVGISFGVDRIYDVMNELDLFPKNELTGTALLLITLDDQAFNHAIGMLPMLRDAGVATELFPEPVKIKKQFQYANRKNIPYTLVVGSEELETGQYTLKNMVSGQQSVLSLSGIIDQIKTEL